MEKVIFKINDKKIYGENIKNKHKEPDIFLTENNNTQSIQNKPVKLIENIYYFRSLINKLSN